MKHSVIAMAMAALFAAPLAASAAGESKSGASAAQGKSDGGAAAMFQRLDKNHDGYLSKAEVKGTPHETEFSTLDKNNDDKLSKAEHAAAPEHAGKAGPASGGTKSK